MIMKAATTIKRVATTINMLAATMMVATMIMAMIPAGDMMEDIEVEATVIETTVIEGEGISINREIPKSAEGADQESVRDEGAAPEGVEGEETQGIAHVHHLRGMRLGLERAHGMTWINREITVKPNLRKESPLRFKMRDLSTLELTLILDRGATTGEVIIHTIKKKLLQHTYTVFRRRLQL